MSKKEGGRLAGVIVMLACFVAIELLAMLVFRVGHLQRSIRPPLEYPYHPYLGWENLSDHRYTGALAGGLHPWAIRTDGLGHIITPAHAFPDPEVHVALVGGSAIFGVGQTGNEHTVASHLEQDLARRTGARVEVHNLAVGGYTSFQEALALERFLSRQRADVVISVSGYNDAFAAAIEAGPDFGLLLHRLDPKTRLMRSIEHGGPPLLAAIVQLVLGEMRLRSAAVDLLGLVSERLRPTPPKVPPAATLPDSAEIARRAAFVLTNYAMMDGMARQNGGRFYMFLQPTAMNRARLTPAELQSLDSLSGEFLERARPVMRIFYPVVIASPHGFEFHDLTRAFDGFAEPAFADECHWLDGATPVLASSIADVVAPAVEAAARRARAAPAKGP